MTHDFKRFPELTNQQLDLYYFESPHKQIFEDFTALVVSVHDGDTISVRWDERDFDFPIRISNISARELHENDKRDTSNQMTMSGKDSQKWLENIILNEEVTIKINPKNRVGKFGRLLGQVIFMGRDMGEEAILFGAASSWKQKNDGAIKNTIRNPIK